MTKTEIVKKRLLRGERVDAYWAMDALNTPYLRDFIYRLKYPKNKKKMGYVIYTEKVPMKSRKGYYTKYYIPEHWLKIYKGE